MEGEPTFDEVMEDMDGGRPRLKLRPQTTRPYVRVAQAMWRLSRDRWLSAEDVMRISVALARRTGSNPHHVAKAAVPRECAVVGMIRGRPPCYAHNIAYGDYVAALHGKASRKDARMELLILNIELRNMKWHLSQCKLPPSATFAA